MRKSKQRKKAMRRILNRKKRLMVISHKQKKLLSKASDENRIHSLLNQVKTDGRVSLPKSRIGNAYPIFY